MQTKMLKRLLPTRIAVQVAMAFHAPLPPLLGVFETNGKRYRLEVPLHLAQRQGLLK